MTNLFLAVISNILFNITGDARLTTATRTAVISNQLYAVKYTYSSQFCTIPATYPAGQPHYSCTVGVEARELLANWICKKAKDGEK